MADAVKLRSQPLNKDSHRHGGGTELFTEGPLGQTFLRPRLFLSQDDTTTDFSRFVRPPWQTCVTLRLDPAKVDRLTDLGRSVANFLEQTLVRTPVPLKFSSPSLELDYPAGWHPEVPVISPRIRRAEPNIMPLRRLPTTSATLDLVTVIQSISPDDWAASGMHVGWDSYEYHVPGLAAIRCTASWISYRGIKAMVWATDADPDAIGKVTAVVLDQSSRTAWRGLSCQITGPPLPGLAHGLGAAETGNLPALPPWGFLTLDVDLEEPPVERLSLDRLSVTLSAETRDKLEKFCLTCLQQMLGFVKHKYVGTPLAEQMEELEGLMRNHYPAVTARRPNSP